MKRVKTESLALAVIIATILVVITTIMWFYIGLTMEINNMKNIISDYRTTEEMEIKENVKSNGETGTKTYKIEIWEDGTVQVTSLAGYLNQISENTVVISDKNLDEVISEIKESMDTPEE